MRLPRPKVVLAVALLTIAPLPSDFGAPASPESSGGLAWAAAPSTTRLRSGYPRLAVLRSGAPPTDVVELGAVHRNLALADLVIFQGNRGKWWDLPHDASGRTLRYYNSRMRILQYLAVDAFPTTPPTGNEIVPYPTDPEAAFHASTFDRENYYDIARVVGSTKSFTVFAQLHPRWVATIQKANYGGLYADWIYANWKSHVFREFVKRTIAEVRAAGFDGMFFDFGSVGYLSSQFGHWTVMPPDCFRLKETGYWYWMSFPGERFASQGPPPSLDALRALDPLAIGAIQDVDFCATTSVPAELSSTDEVDPLILDFYGDLRRSTDLTLIWNGAHEGSAHRNDIVLTHTDGGHQEGFGLTELTAAGLRAELDMVESFNAKGKVFIGWNRGYDAASTLYGYVACMMAGGPLTYCEFSEAVPADSLIQLDPGRPAGRYVTLPTGEQDLNRIVYKRTWKKAIMYLNPTQSTLTVDGRTLGPKTGLVIPR